MLVLRTSNFKGATASSKRLTLYCLYCPTQTFLPRGGSKIILNYFQHFWMKAMKAINTIGSRDQFKPIRIGENLVVNYNG